MLNEKYQKVQANLLKLHASLPWTHMSREVGLSATTIKRFANNESNSPHFRTVDLLADYAGFRIMIEGMEGSNMVLQLVRNN